MQENDDAAQTGCDDRCNKVALGIFAHAGQNLRDNDTGGQAADGGAHTTRGSQRGAFGVVGGHGAQQGAHADVHHCVAALIDDLEDEQRHQHRDAAAHTGRDTVKRDHAEHNKRDGRQNPGPEFVFARFCLGKGDVHDGTHERVIDCIPHVPYQEHCCKDAGIYFQLHLQVTAHIHGHHVYGNNTARIAAAVANHIFKFQFGNGALRFYRVFHF